MALEVELKFPLESFDSLVSILENKGKKLSTWYFEQNIVLDTQEQLLKGKDILLRLRKGLDHVLTLKFPEVDTDGLVKKREELEAKVEDIYILEDIFKTLGFFPFLTYEKFRQKWELEDCKICLDILPFGNFIEIEGDKIFQAAKILRLAVEQGTKKTYYELFQDFLKSHNLPLEESFVFSEKEKELIAARLGVKI
ncbi:class IV adenylate cyclase [Desulfohalobiaceae bacterium Ax17]|jgi:adenylate cyclase class 2|uniref:class IV adenylate cyclase n=1 Tax=Desulfovulcanus ferrireducens TaxID=2831190 RepID=UPI00207BCDDB|nr:class IV adenylate cyclase [Desulfovulcanus ferrireducens]MBT8762510.1 class IV adenylate cyclase [Desulfovulcanus ferrireducens]